MASDRRNIAAAYDRASALYDKWQWQEFWRHNEQPLVRQLLERDGVVDITLDIGVGTGAYVGLLSAYSRKVIGIDISGGMLAVSLANHPAVTHIYASAFELPFRESTFQRIVTIRMLSHAPSLGNFFREVSRTLRPGGSLIVSDLDPDHDYEVINLPARDVNDRPVQLVPNKHSVDQLSNVAARYGLTLESHCRVRFSDLDWKPQADQLLSLDRSGLKSVFYVAQFRKLKLSEA
jgi:ubiquinone/menaquinone biosynthesis C-methylase UbiE